MKSRWSFLALGLVGILALTPGCGDDEGTGDDGGNDGCGSDEDCPANEDCVDLRGDGDGFCQSGETCACVPSNQGGSGGSSGSSGGTSPRGGSSGATLGGSGGQGGSSSGGSSTGGTAGTAPTTALGEPCGSDADCDGLFCLTPDGLPSGDGPPNGMCTKACEANDECLELANSAYCVGFEEDDAGEVVSYCILGCLGSTRGDPKCGQRDDFACSILATAPTEQTCTEHIDCTIDQICFAEVEGDPDVCNDMLTACRPVCRADSDCAAGQFCDFASGFCTGTEPTGLPIGSLCDPTLPPAQDECNGFCSATDETNTQGTCAAFCSAGLDAYGCGWVGEGAPDAGCLFATIISRDEADDTTLALSDLMICGGLCDCNDDCPADGEYCMDENKANAMASIEALFGRKGYCRALSAQRGETEEDSFACAQAAK